MAEIVYTVWGGYQDQEDGDHWATFRDPDLAERYRSRQEAVNPRLLLGIMRDQARPGETFADDEERAWEVCQGTAQE